MAANFRIYDLFKFKNEFKWIYNVSCVIEMGIFE